MTGSDGAKGMLRVDQVHVIRHKVLVEGLSMRRVAEEMRLSRNTVRKYLSQSEPVRREEGPRARPVRATSCIRSGEGADSRRCRDRRTPRSPRMSPARRRLAQRARAAPTHTPQAAFRSLVRRGSTRYGGAA